MLKIRLSHRLLRYLNPTAFLHLGAALKVLYNTHPLVPIPGDGRQTLGGQHW